MLEQIFPLFTSGRLLRHEMLEATVDYAFLFGKLLYQDYADGIISGCSLTTTKDTLTLNQGIICHGGNLFLIKEPVSIKYESTDKVCSFQLHFLEEMQKGNCISYRVEAILTESMEYSENQIEICRFRLQEGAYLRDQYVDFKDRSTEYDTLNTIHSPCACKFKSTLLPEITYAFAKEMLSCSLENPADISFCLQAMNIERPLSFETIAAYIRLKTGPMPLSKNIDLYKGLREILSKTKHGTGDRIENKPRPHRKIFID